MTEGKNDSTSKLLEPRRSFVTCGSTDGFHRVRLFEFGAPDNPNIMVCVHGLTRNSHDFDCFIPYFVEKYRIVCVDVVGRGESDCFKNKMLYGYPQYVSDMVTVLAKICPSGQQVTWVGTSMGGAIGMMLSASAPVDAALPHPIKLLVLNDIGPIFAKEAIQRIASYVGLGVTFADLHEAGEYFEKAYGFSKTLGKERWERFVANSVVLDAESKRYRLAYDQDIRKPFTAAKLDVDVDLTPLWFKIRCPVLVLHGKKSDLLLPAHCEKLIEWSESKKGPQTTILHYDNAHPCPLADYDSPDVAKWLADNDKTFVASKS